MVCDLLSFNKNSKNSKTISAMRCNLLELEIPFPHDANDYFSPHDIKYQFD